MTATPRIDPVLSGARIGWRPPTSLTLWQWGEKHLTLQNSSRSSRFLASETPWLMAPLECAADPEIFQVVMVAPTGSGKSTMAEVLFAYIVCEDPGNLLYASQTDPDAAFWAETRLVPTLKACKQMDGLWSDDRNKTRKLEIILPHMAMSMGGANLSNFTSNSCRWLYGDEVWIWAEGLIREFHARHHNRWNRKIYLVSQGGTTQSEFHDEWQKTDKAEYSWKCDACKVAQIYSFDSLRFDRIEREDGTLDEQATSETARMECANCRAQYADTAANRRKLANSNLGNGHKGYIPQDNPQALAGNRGFHVDRLAVFDVPWSKDVLNFLEAQRMMKAGIVDKLRQWKQKDRAQFWDDSMADVKIELSRSADFSKTEHDDGQPIEGEVARAMTADAQKDHFWVIIMAWRAGGTSRILFEGFVQSDGTGAALDALAKKYRVPPNHVLIDTQYDQPEADTIGELCARYGWLGVRGNGKVRGFPYRTKSGKSAERLYSKIYRAPAKSGGIARYIWLATNPVKDIAHRILTGEGSACELPGDLSKTFENHVRAEQRETVRDKNGHEMTVWVQKNRNNHLWDCFVYQVLFALIYGCFHVSEEE